MVKLLSKRPSRNHYDADIEPIDLIVSLGIAIPFCRGNIIKYVARYDKKGGIKDLLKARQYLDWLIELEEKNVPTEQVLPRTSEHDQPPSDDSGGNSGGCWRG